MQENDYLDLVNQLKEINERRDKNEKKLRQKLMDYQKNMMSIYGMIRYISNNINQFDTENRDDSFFLIDILRGMVSEIIEKDFIKFTPLYEEDSDDDMI